MPGITGPPLVSERAKPDVKGPPCALLGPGDMSCGVPGGPPPGVPCVGVGGAAKGRLIVVLAETLDRAADNIKQLSYLTAS